jgi:methionyl-tRNA formyltransferase
LSPYPGAYTEITAADGTSFNLKIIRATPEIQSHEWIPGQVICDGRTYIKVAVPDGYMHLTELQPSGRSPMVLLDFLRGYGRHFI